MFCFIFFLKFQKRITAIIQVMIRSAMAMSSVEREEGAAAGSQSVSVITFLPPQSILGRLAEGVPVTVALPKYVYCYDIQLILQVDCSMPVRHTSLF